MAAKMDSLRERGVRSFHRSMTGGVMDVGYVSGCRDDQTSADTFEDGKPCGAFTWAFLKALQSLPSDTPLERVVLETRSILVKHGYDQIPQVSGTRISKPFLG